MRYFLMLSLSFFVLACQQQQSSTNSSASLVNTNEALYKAIESAEPGTQITMANGVWKDVNIQLEGNGTAEQPIILKAETAGEVFLEGQSDLKLGGTYLEIHDLFFRNGHTPSQAVIAFKIDNEKIASHCRVTNTVIEDYNQLKRDRKDHWVEFWGRHNQMDRCYIAGKSNEGPTLRVDIKGRENINNYHQIINNYFGPRPRKGGPKAETIQIGDSGTSMSPSYTNISNNLFDRCNGEVEVISSKTNFNEFRNNVFYKCEGSLVTRHGNYCIVDGNYFIGDENNNVGGVRLINTGHWVTNNYFYNLKGTEFRSPLAIMNGIPKSPLNRYNQVTDVVVAHNTWVNCQSPWHFGVGTNISQKDVLPKSEIRSARPIRTVVANNIIYNEKGDSKPIVAHDQIDGITFKNNLISNQNTNFEKVDGVIARSMEMVAVNDYLYSPKTIQNDEDVYMGFDFEKIDKDLMGNARTEKSNTAGAMNQTFSSDPNLLNKSKYGPSWFSTETVAANPETLNATAADLVQKIAQAQDGDIITLASGVYTISQPIIINKKITIQSKDKENKAQINYAGAANTPAFELHPKGNLNLQQVNLTGNNDVYAFASLKKNMSSLYNLSVADSEISNFNYVLKAYKETFADEITFTNTALKNCQNGIELSAETNDKGDYNVEFLTIQNCQFENIKKNVIDYYRGGYDESTIGGNLLVTNSTFTNCGAQEENGILLNTRGIINVDITKNTFNNNSVKLVALLWGAKNNNHSENKISNSGKIVVQENIALKLIY